MISAKNNGFNIKDQDILKEVVQDVLKRENEARLKTLKKNWYPTHKPFFDNECKVIKYRKNKGCE